MLDLFWDFHQQRHLWGLQSDSRSMQSKQNRHEDVLMRLEDKIDTMQRSLDKQTLITMALWELLKQKTALTDAELMAEVERIDLLDGKADGRYTPPAQDEPKSFVCEKCGRSVSRVHMRCFYCGESARYDVPGDAT